MMVRNGMGPSSSYDDRTIQMNRTEIASNYSADRPAEQDSLGRSEFATHLAIALRTVCATDGLVVGIEGGWGTGKSTVIGFVKKALSEQKNSEVKVIVVDFNPWMVSNTGVLIEALVTQIAAAINLDSLSPEKAVKVGEKLLNYVGLLRHLKYLKYLPGGGFVGHIAEDVSSLADAAGSAAKEAGEAVGDLKKVLPSLDLATRKADVAEALRELGQPLVVVIDDVDRLPADEIRIIVQAVKAVADFPRTTYLIAYDREVVAAALGNGNTASGNSYLEKIVQVAYPIPPLFQYQMRTFAGKKLQGLFTALGLELRSFEAAAYAPALSLLAQIARHPRDVVRLANRLMLSLPATRHEVNVIDVVIFEAISQRFPELREVVHRHPSDFTGHPFRDDTTTNDQSRDWMAWASLVAARDRGTAGWQKHLPKDEADFAIAKKACEFLFPSTDRGADRVPEDELHIADPDRLARYFRMMSLESVPEAAYIHTLLRHPERLADALDGIEMAMTLEWAYNYLPSCASPDICGCMETIVTRAKQATRATEQTKELIELFVKVCRRLIAMAAGDARIEAFQRAIEDAPLSISESILLEAAAEQGKWYVHPEKQKPQKDQLVPDCIAVDNAIQIWSERVRKALASDQLHEEPRMHAILYRFAQLNYAYDEAYEGVSKVCSTDEGLEVFLAVYTEGDDFGWMSHYALIASPQEFAVRIRGSSMNAQYSWFAKKLSDPQFSQAVEDQARRLKTLKRPPAALPSQ